MAKSFNVTKEINSILAAALPKKRPTKKKMNWKQAKKKYPKLDPLGNIDGDLMPNVIDCKPFDKKKHMAFVYDNGGRKACGFKGKTGDCGTRAIAIAEGKNYKDTYKEIAYKLKKMKPVKKGRGDGTSHPRTGIYNEHMKQLLAEMGYTWIPTSGIGKGFKMHVKEGELPKGTNILRLSKHFVASKDQDWHDTFDSSREGTRGVYGYYHKPTPIADDWDGDGTHNAEDERPLDPTVKVIPIFDAMQYKDQIVSTEKDKYGSPVSPKGKENYPEEIYGPLQEPEDLIRGLDEEEKQLYSSHIIVNKDDKVVGYVKGEDRPSRKDYYIEEIRIDDDEKRKKYGTSAIKELAKQKGQITGIVDNTEEAKAFWNKYTKPESKFPQYGQRGSTEEELEGQYLFMSTEEDIEKAKQIPDEEKEKRSKEQFKNIKKSLGKLYAGNDEPTSTEPEEEKEKEEEKEEEKEQENEEETEEEQESEENFSRSE